jgi:hypothetical protein
MTEAPLPAQLRSKEDFDYFITSRHGDPWQMDGNKHEIARFEIYIAFISKYISKTFSGTFVEGGCFNGDFTKRLLRLFREVILSQTIYPQQPYRRQRTG